MKAPGGILRTPRHRLTREESLSRWDADAKYHGVANHVRPSQNKLRPRAGDLVSRGPLGGCSVELMRKRDLA